MRTLIGALLAMTVLTPTLAAAQEARIGAGAGFARDDRRGPENDRRAPDDDRRGRIDDRRTPRGDDRRADVPRDRFDGGELRQAPPPPAIRDRRDGERAYDGADVDRRRFADRDRNDGDRTGRWAGRDDRWAGRDRDTRRRQDDWTRSRFGRPDDRWRSSRFRAGGDWDRAGDRGWDRGWRNDGRYDWSRYRATNRDAYRLPRYYAPGGRSTYRRFAIGSGLQASLWAQDYWIADPYSYHLPAAYGAFRWVRYYDDALLIDLDSGRVVDAVYGIFW